MAVKYNLGNARLYDTPMETLKIEQANKTDETIKYRNLIGELLYRLLKNNRIGHISRDRAENSKIKSPVQKRDPIDRFSVID